MPSIAARASQSYRHLAVESAALGGDQHQLVALMYSAALASIAKARHALAACDIQRKTEECHRAIRIVDEGLKAVVDRNAGELARNLYELYDYCVRRLLLAHAHNDDRMLAEVSHLLGEVSQAWSAIGAKAVPR
ncbi:MAG TPA: flagellar export chaperone FliS [Burkholderiaceae bacterium]|jgi:flagellar secretion chaperone FliS|nr:flagellar export chaperone FliS [Burkholderiaceae bacterium]